jgi:hypothetical protein
VCEPDDCDLTVGAGRLAKIKVRMNHSRGSRTRNLTCKSVTASSQPVLHVKKQDEQVNVRVPMTSLPRERREG